MGIISTKDSLQFKKHKPNSGCYRCITAEFTMNQYTLLSYVFPFCFDRDNFDRERREVGAVCVGTGKMSPGGEIKPSVAQPCKPGFVSRTK